jgi:hypothetical protein
MDLDPRKLNLGRFLDEAALHATTVRDVARSGNVAVTLSLLGPAVRGFVLRRGRAGDTAPMPTEYVSRFTWDYRSTDTELAKLYAAAKAEAWKAEDLDWSLDVDPHHPERVLVSDDALALGNLAAYRGLPKHRQEEHRAALFSWMLSQALHGEQGALFAACQVVETIRGYDGKLFGATQVADEGRHVEVFSRYLREKMGRIWPIDPNLYVILDALMTDSRWDVKFLGMQILVEGLALGAFSTFRASSAEPLLRELLRRVITDEARHVHYGVVALRDHYRNELPERERRDREDWAYELVVLLRNRFLAHDFYDEYYAASIPRAEWDKGVLESGYMTTLRDKMFRRIVPNLKRIGLLTDRIRPHYRALGLLAYEHERPATELTAADLLGDVKAG